MCFIHFWEYFHGRRFNLYVMALEVKVEPLGVSIFNGNMELLSMATICYAHVRQMRLAYFLPEGGQMLIAFAIIIITWTSIRHAFDKTCQILCCFILLFFQVIVFVLVKWKLDSKFQYFVSNIYDIYLSVLLSWNIQTSDMLNKLCSFDMSSLSVNALWLLHVYQYYVVSSFSNKII